jgi:hypothetical protein
MWTHGTAARPEWAGGTSHTTGPFDPANPFQSSQKGYWFHFALPTPSVIASRPARLMRIFLLWEARRGVHPAALHVFDGPGRIATLPITHTPDATGTATTGSNPAIDGMSRFELTPHTVMLSIGLSVAVACEQDGDVTFFAAGAAYDA